MKRKIIRYMIVDEYDAIDDTMMFTNKKDAFENLDSYDEKVIQVEIKEIKEVKK